MTAGNGWIARPMAGFDTETTGVDVDRDRIVSAALVRRSAGPGPAGPSSQVSAWLLDPGIPIPAAATAVHGIDTATARQQGQAPGAAVEEIATALVAALRRGEPLVAYNAAYDLTLLDAELARHGRS
ncbi:exonuclease domain-containing protein, partial [Actinotalea sp.]|uniref:exonuclease domain-containing protein n=1 Tax=Actinotalea sp. TaxID=1872145 RepID=UPI0035667E35